jgi:hypothetical protein
VKDDSGDLLADSHNILNRWKNHFSQLLKVNNLSDIRQTEVHTISHLEVEIAIAKLKKCKSPSSDKNSGRRRNDTVCNPQTHSFCLE